MDKIKNFIKREAVLSAACLLAVVSAFIVPPDSGYIEYIDVRTLSILFSLMAVMAGLREMGVFGSMARVLLNRVKSTRQLIFILVMLCFFSSMLITNDVALITFVPFTFIVLDILGKDEKDRLIIPVTVIQTAAANLGSMLTPIGNPQNLYLYGKSGISLTDFIMIMLPYSAVSLLMITVHIFIVCRREHGGISVDLTGGENKISLGKTALYLILFLLCVMTVARVVPFYISLAAVVVSVFIADRKILGKVDYSLLITFTGFFIFIGNMGRIPAFSDFLKSVVSGKELITAAAASQIISNVPAALLLSGFTDNYTALIIGTNLGGLGTLIASMASLISYKYAAAENENIKGKYILYFTVVNVIYLAVLTAFNLIASDFLISDF